MVKKIIKEEELIEKSKI